MKWEDDCEIIVSGLERLHIYSCMCEVKTLHEAGCPSAREYERLIMRLILLHGGKVEVE
jgi:hypothetical protein